jgi:ubiquitin carboxyl-terminal hydrolase 7
LKRFDYDIYGNTVKINDNYEFPLEINLDDFLAEDADRTDPATYHLHGVLVHSGDVGGGHYFAMIKPTKEDKWFRFDDERVIPVTHWEVLEENFGGDPPTGDGGGSGAAAKTIRRFTNAYMLVYVRESALDWVLDPVTEVDVPNHVISALQEEMAQHEAMVKEYEERHLYCGVKVLRDVDIQAHQGLDLFDFQDPNQVATLLTFRVRKEALWAELAEQVALQTNIPTEKFRLWTLVSRQNRTVRPDGPIHKYDDSTLETIKQKLFSKWNDVRLYMETAGSPLPDKDFLPVGNDGIEAANIFVFIKYFDVEQQKLHYLGKLYLPRTGKVMDIHPRLCEMANLPTTSKIRVFEEVKPVMIEPLDAKKTFKTLELQDGDILVFQKEDVQHAKYKEAPKFYDYLVHRVTVKMVARNGDDEAFPEGFKLEVHRKDKWEVLLSKVATTLNIPETHILFSKCGPTGAAQDLMRRTGVVEIGDLLPPVHAAGSYMFPNTIFYQAFEVDVSELETKTYVTVEWVSLPMSEPKPIKLLVPKDGALGDVKKLLMEHVTLNAELGSGQVRFWEVLRNRMRTVHFNDDTPLSTIAPFTTLYAEVHFECCAEWRRKFL